MASSLNALVGFFGPIGVSAIFYLYISREFLKEVSGRQDVEKVSEAIDIVVWFLVICSIVVHGLVISLSKLGLYLPRTLSTAISFERISASLSRERNEDLGATERGQAVRDVDDLQMRPFHRRPTTSEQGPSGPNSKSGHWIPRSFLRAGKHVLDDIRRPSGDLSEATKRKGSSKNQTAPVEQSPMGHP